MSETVIVRKVSGAEKTEINKEVSETGETIIVRKVSAAEETVINKEVSEIQETEETDRSRIVTYGTKTLMEKVSQAYADEPGSMCDHSIHLSFFVYADAAGIYGTKA